MFTGIVEARAQVAELRAHGAVTRLGVRAPTLAREVAVGDSVAVSGACLTIAARDPELLLFDVVQETLARTALGSLRAGDEVNLERALLASARVDGHFVQGHVDETGVVRELARAGDVRLRVTASANFLAHLVAKGSVAVDGVALTLTALGAQSFEVALIPHTLTHTTLGALEAGRAVNLEADVLGKYVLRYLERIGVAKPGALA